MKKLKVIGIILGIIIVISGIFSLINWIMKKHAFKHYNEDDFLDYWED